MKELELLLPEPLLFKGRELDRRVIVDERVAGVIVQYICPDFFECPSGFNGIFVNLTFSNEELQQHLPDVAAAKLRDAMYTLNECVRQEDEKGCLLRG